MMTKVLQTVTDGSSAISELSSFVSLSNMKDSASAILLESFILEENENLNRVQNAESIH